MVAPAPETPLFACYRPTGGITAARHWQRARPDLDGWLRQPSNQYESEAHTFDVFPGSDRIVDLASVGCTPGPAGCYRLRLDAPGDHWRCRIDERAGHWAAGSLPTVSRSAIVAGSDAICRGGQVAY